MKKIFNKQSYIFLATVVMLSLTQVWSFAQDSSGSSGSSTTTTTTTSQTTTVQPWVWVVGGIVLLIIIIALVRGNRGSNSPNGRTDKVTYTKTTSSGDNP